LIVWALVQSRGDGHRSLVTPERVLNEYNENLDFFWSIKIEKLHCRSNILQSNFHYYMSAVMRYILHYGIKALHQRKVT